MAIVSVHEGELRASEFQYRTLEDGQIRLFSFLPQSSLELIQLHLAEHALGQHDEDGSDFIALSYTWGSRLKTKDILVNGKHFAVTRNCFQALLAAWHRRDNNPWNSYWIDSICINQADLEEKSRQVNRIGEVYKTSQATLAYVGDAQDDSDMFLTVLNTVASQGLLKSYDSWTALLHLVLRNLDFSQDRFDDALVMFECREYWSRTWVLQELYLSRCVIVMCGQKDIDWNVLRLDIFTFFNYDAPSRKELMRQLKGKGLLGGSQTPLHRMCMHRNHLRDGSKLRTLYWTLTMFQDWKCTEPLDRVYGLYGLIDPLTELKLPAVDYTLTPLELAIAILPIFVADQPDSGHSGAGIVQKALQLSDAEKEIVQQELTRIAEGDKTSDERISMGRN